MAHERDEARHDEERDAPHGRDSALAQRADGAVALARELGQRGRRDAHARTG